MKNRVVVVVDFIDHHDHSIFQIISFLC